MNLRILCGALILAALAAQAASYQEAVLADNPPGYWRLDTIPITVVSAAQNLGTAGADANGVIGNGVREGRPGAIVGDPDPSMQLIGNASSRITVPYNWLLNQGGPFTFECWMNPACRLGNALALVVNRQGESGYTVYINGDGSLGFNMNRGPGGGYWSSCVITNPSTVASMIGRWTHLACVYDPSAGSTGFGVEYIYTNGVLAASNEIPDAPWVPNSGGPFVIGDRNYSGGLDEVASYAVALSAERLMAHYRAGTNGLGQYQAEVLADAPEGYWRLNETDGFMPAPVLAENLGTIGAAARATCDLGLKLGQEGALAGRADQAALFDGVNMVQAPAGAALNPAAPFSVEFWARPTIVYTGATAQACVVGSTDRDFGRSGWLFYQGGNGWSWWLGDTANYTIQLDPNTPIDPTKWYHLVGTYDGTTARLYVNGVEAASQSGGFSPNNSKPMTLGGRYDATFGYQGRVDEVAVYGTLLAPADVLAHYQNGTNPAPAQSYESLVLSQSPLAYWRLNESSTGPGTGVVNSGWLGAAVNGTVVGTVTLNADSPLVSDSNPSVDFTEGGRIAIPFDANLNKTNAFSYECWYKQTLGTGSSHRCPLWWRDEPVLGDTRGWVHYVVNEGNTFQSSDVWTTWNGLGSPTLFEQGAWQHLVCTFDGQTKRIYLNGVTIAVSTTARLAVKPVTRAVNTISSASYPWIGSIDEVAIYTNALPVERVQAHWFAARGVNPPAVAPTFALDAVGTTKFEGDTVTVRTIALGTAPFTYQWFKGTTPVPGQTTDTLTLSPAREADSGDYRLSVSNAGGTADSATVTVLIQKAPPTILADPQPALRLQGSSVTFAVDCGGSLPLTYQWKSNHVDLAGANASTLTLVNLQPSFAAAYAVTISNAAGTATSQAASLTVVPVAADSLAAAVVADHPTAYWRMNETSDVVAHDYVGGHDGIYDYTVTLEQPGAVLGDTDFSAAFVPGGQAGGVLVPYSPKLNPYTTFSLEAWVKIDPNGAGTDRPILWSSTTYAGWAYGYVLSADATDAWAFTTGQKTSGFNTITGGTATADANWAHLVCTMDDATGDKRLYVNGELVAQTTTAPGTFAPNQKTEDETPPFDQGIGWDVRNYAGFYGGLDEVAFYDYPLSPAQVAAHRAAGSAPTVRISATPDGQVTLTWSLGRLVENADPGSSVWAPVTGATSPYTIAPAGTAKFYRAIYP